MASKQQFGVYLDKELLDKVEYLSKLTYRKKSDMIRMWVEHGIEFTFLELEQLKKIKEED